MENDLFSQTRALEDAFFLKEDRELIEKLQQLKKMTETKETLKSVSGIQNDEVLDKLVKLGVQAETVAALAVIPLVEVAWADGHVDGNERKTILENVHKHGVSKGSMEYDLLEEWLGHKPTPALLSAWVHYIEGLSLGLTPAERKKFKDTLLHDVRAVAESSGGFLGVGKISAAEKEMIQKLEKAFG